MNQEKEIMEIFLLGLTTVLIGAALTFAGYQFFRVIIPIWGFFVGFSWAAQAIATGMNAGFLATALGWMTGLLVGAVMAVLAYFFYEVAVILLAGSVGYMLIAAFFAAFGIDMGFLTTVLAAAVAVGFGIAAVYIKAPKVLLIVFSAIAGATAIVGGFMVMFGLAPLSIVGSGFTPALIGQSFFWTMAWFGLMGFGALSQVALTQSIDLYETETEYESSYGFHDYGSLAGTKGGEAKRTEEDIDTKTDTTDKDMKDSSSAS